MSFTTTGLKKVFIKRFFTDQIDNQDVALYISGPQATFAPIDLVQRLELHPQATKSLEDAGFMSGSDVKLMTSEEVGSLGLLFQTC
ncbi:hypothetical protein BV898_05230 [Hypsibius exemplaris]|uniref:Uncharacterized protein n=1 Tax=Hypsibius exemplaris TaxID=2072580 RepID=A0A1W0X0D4_HYPEX|nr:hypothetical protein BV898_05230 [Hypsibius exemplaris]